MKRKAKIGRPKNGEFFKKKAAQTEELLKKEREIRAGMEKDQRELNEQFEKLSTAYTRLALEAGVI